MKLWIAEETQGNALLQDPSKEMLLSMLRTQSKKWPASKIFCWHVWQIDPKLDRDFLKNIIKESFGFRDIPNVNGTFEIIDIRDGKRIPSPKNYNQRRDSHPSEWST